MPRSHYCHEAVCASKHLQSTPRQTLRAKHKKRGEERDQTRCRWNSACHGDIGRASHRRDDGALTGSPCVCQAAAVCLLAAGKRENPLQSRRKPGLKPGENLLDTLATRGEAVDVSVGQLARSRDGEGDDPRMMRLDDRCHDATILRRAPRHAAPVRRAREVDEQRRRHEVGDDTMQATSSATPRATPCDSDSPRGRPTSHAEAATRDDDSDMKSSIRTRLPTRLRQTRDDRRAAATKRSEHSCAVTRKTRRVRKQ